MVSSLSQKKVHLYKDAAVSDALLLLPHHQTSWMHPYSKWAPVVSLNAACSSEFAPLCCACFSLSLELSQKLIPALHGNFDILNQGLGNGALGAWPAHHSTVICMPSKRLMETTGKLQRAALYQYRMPQCVCSMTRSR